MYQWWMNKGYFKAQDVSTKPPYCIILPPPNVTGSLHMGHALNHSIQDALIRWKRMSGFNALWLPGTDHAGIATQSVVEKQLAKEGKTRHQIGRTDFVAKVWEWKEQYGERIIEQMKRLGDSCDWDRLCFTLDEGVSTAVRKVFVQLYKKNWIYKGTRLINWSPKLESALSDLEVDYKEVKGSLWHIRYPLEDGTGHLVVATTRPETLLGDTAVAVHPEDERYSSLIGKSVKLPLTDRLIKIIGDDYVDREFGSGVVKITPAHDFNDYEIGKRHQLESISILDRKGALNENVPKAYQGLTAKKAREQVVSDLESGGFLEKIESHIHSVGHCSRSGVVVEPLLSEQWFVKTSEISLPAKRVVESGTVLFEPESWTKTYLHWMNIIQDWCISRQLWWGHRIPAWHCDDCRHVTVVEADPQNCENCQSTHIRQEEDVLDTWFSSALWPFSTMGWPNETEALRTFYPTNVVVTGHDIIFFWVARMIMAGLEFKKDVPFRSVYIHGLVRDSEGRKMSKSLGNSADPVELIEKFGADALRFTLLSQVSTGKDLKFSDQRLEGYRNFMNKLWNATRFALKAIEDVDFKSVSIDDLPPLNDLSHADQWIIYKMSICMKEVETSLESYRFSDAANAIYSFAWHEFCDWYLEFIKPVVYGRESSEKRATQIVLAQVLNRLMRLLHPFVPFISEELYQKLPIRGEACVVDRYPTILSDRNWLKGGSQEQAFELDVVKGVITALRNIRGENQIKPGQEITARLVPSEDKLQKILQSNKVAIMRLAKLGLCEIGEAGSLRKCAISPFVVGENKVMVVVPLEGIVDLEEEVKRLEKVIEKGEKEVSGISMRLRNDNFVKNAPPEIVIQARAQLEEQQIKLASLRENLARLR
ncbi:MAG: valine--tRNA ligase [Bdellovibrionales bacterium]|nr:valine--tRNA ligase [Bdellovibrionales bacterium]